MSGQSLTTKEAGVTQEGLTKVRNWLRAKDEVRIRQAALEKAQAELDQCADEFARWILPPDRRPQEKISVWIWDSLFSAELVGASPGDFFNPPKDIHKVEIRYAGAKINELLW